MQLLKGSENFLACCHSSCLGVLLCGCYGVAIDFEYLVGMLPWTFSCFQNISIFFPSSINWELVNQNWNGNQCCYSCGKTAEILNTSIKHLLFSDWVCVCRQVCVHRCIKSVFIYHWFCHLFSDILLKQCNVSLRPPTFIYITAFMNISFCNPFKLFTETQLQKCFVLNRQLNAFKHITIIIHIWRGI